MAKSIQLALVLSILSVQFAVANPVGARHALDEQIKEDAQRLRTRWEKNDLFKELLNPLTDEDAKKKAYNSMDMDKVVDLLVQKGMRMHDKLMAARVGAATLISKNKQPFDISTVVAVDREFHRIAVPLVDMLKGIRQGVIDKNDPEIKQFLINELTMMNMNELLVAYTNEMLNISNVKPAYVKASALNINDLATLTVGDLRKKLEENKIESATPSDQEKQESDDFLQRLAMARVQADPAYKTDIEANWTRKVGETELSPASDVGAKFDKIYGHVFSNRPGRLDPDTTEVGRSYLRGEYVPSIFVKVTAEKTEEWRKTYNDRQAALKKAAEAAK